MNHRTTRQRGQAGVTLVEVLVMIGVVVPVILAATYGMFTAVSTGSGAETQSRLEALLSERTEELKSGSYIACGTPDDYTQSLSAPAPTTSTQVINVRYWSQETASFVDLKSCEKSGESDGDGTPGGSGVDGGAQQLTVSVTLAGESLVGVIVSRDADSMPSAPAGKTP